MAGTTACAVSTVMCWIVKQCLLFRLKWILLMLRLQLFKLRLAHSVRTYRLSRQLRDTVRLANENDAMREVHVQSERKQPKDPPKAVLHLKKPYVKWKRRRDYRQREQEDSWCSSAFHPRTYAWHSQHGGKRDRSTGERTTPMYEYPESSVLPPEFDREAHLRAVKAHEEADREQQREAERRRKERAQRERVDRNDRNNRPAGRLRTAAQPAGWPAQAPDRADSAKRTTEKERSLHRVREHQRQLEELERLRVAQLAKMDELRRIGREIGGS